ncbi:MAG: penicillin-binding protein 2 [Candidatus Omnitrophica bacterium]|nr:penicillin-binding protein 2 [Candidatus Omnitrophota bacterium]
MNSSTNHRLAAITAGLMAALGVIWLRCGWLQGVQAGRLARMAKAQHETARGLLAERGTIYDRHGRVLAMSVGIPSVFANPRQMPAKQRAALELAKALGRDPTAIGRRLARDKGFVWIARHINPQIKGRLDPFRRDGVGFVEEPKRIYPQGPSASHIVGSVDIDERGLEGVEMALNNALRGRPGWRATLRDGKGDLLIGPWTVETPPQRGFDLVLTIDSVVQETAEEALSWGVEKFHAKGGSVIVMDPATGEILGLANWPQFDPNQPGRSSPGSRRNRAITDVMEPGSVFKIVTASALLQEGLARPDEQVFCEDGAFPTVARHVLHDHRSHGWLSFHDVVRYSSNIGTAKLAQRLSPELLYGYIRQFGFGRKTGIDLPGEVSGMIAPPARWSKLSPWIIPIGQEVGVTPIQMAVMTAVIANGGWRVRPHVVARLQTAEGRTIRDFRAPSRAQLLRPQAVEQMNAMLVSVVESGTGQLANIRGLTVAGKTGTAQKLEPNGRYSHSRYIASFVGYGPVPDSRFVIVASIDEPRPLYFGGVVAAPVFKRIVENLAGYWELKHSAGPQTLAQLP